MHPPDIPAPDPSLLARNLVTWFAIHGRDLPWRDSRDPYAVWVSEIMLQQTQVTTAAPYFERWMRRFPDLTALATAEEADVLRHWEGLGYYARARNLHRAARRVVDVHEGRIPRTREGLMELPGIGRYTAGAIAAIAYGEAVAAVDGNVKRVIARLWGIEGELAQPAVTRRIESLAEEVMAAQAEANLAGSPGDLAQALMELGAVVCTARQPDCPACPVSTACTALRLGRVAEIPAPARRTAQRVEERVALVLRESQTGDYLVVRRTASGLLGGLWEFPLVKATAWERRVEGLEASSDVGKPSEPTALLDDGTRWDELAPLGLEGLVGLAAGTSDWREGRSIIHIFTHIRMTVTPLFRVVSGSPTILPTPYDAWRWIAWEGLADLPKSTLMTKLMATVDHIS